MVSLQVAVDIFARLAARARGHLRLPFIAPSGQNFTELPTNAPESHNHHETSNALVTAGHRGRHRRGWRASSAFQGCAGSPFQGCAGSRLPAEWANPGAPPRRQHQLRLFLFFVLLRCLSQSWNRGVTHDHGTALRAPKLGNATTTNRKKHKHRYAMLCNSAL